MTNSEGNVLLVSPIWSNLHIDISDELKRQGYTLQFIEEYSFPEDPLRIKGKRIQVDDDVAEQMKTSYWQKHLEKITCCVDNVLVIDGQGINSYFFETLKKNNPQVRFVNYLFDTTYSVYHFEANFPFYDKVVSFDPKDVASFSIDYLPIYWVPNENVNRPSQYDIFGFGTYSKDRYDLYKTIYTIAKKEGMCCYLRTYHNKIANKPLHILNNLHRKLTGQRPLISLKEYHSAFISHELISPSQFREFIEASQVIVDTKFLNQEGMTARFMWALGLGKRIITTNEAVKKYDFYSENQICVVSTDDPIEVQKKHIADFLHHPSFVFKNSDIVEPYRLDHWIEYLLS